MKDYLGSRDMKAMDIFAEAGGAFGKKPLGHQAKGDFFLFHSLAKYSSTPVFWNDKIPSGHPRAFVQAILLMVTRFLGSYQSPSILLSQILCHGIGG